VSRRVSRETGVQLAWRWTAVALAVWCVVRGVLAAVLAWPGLLPLIVAAVVMAVGATSADPRWVAIRQGGQQ
jgi:ABC-type transport system involved in cytochrome c biogenesis permease component